MRRDFLLSRLGPLLILSLLVTAGLFARENGASSDDIRLQIIQTSDIHGNFFPWDFIEKRPGTGGLSRVSTYVRQQRSLDGNRVLLFDNGDILQGQPTAYYYNFIDTTAVHLCARMLDYIGYDGATVGNHDIETGHKVYDRYRSSCSFPWLAANALKEDGSGSYFDPFFIYETDGVRVAVLGMVTPAIPAWLPKILWPGIYFEEVQKCASTWIPYLRREMKADVVIGLFHLGYESRIVMDDLDESGGEKLAYALPGLDVLLLGHDHSLLCKKVVNISGDSTLIVNPANNGNFVGSVELKIDRKSKTVKSCVGKLVDMAAYQPDEEFLAHFRSDYEAVQSFVSRKLTSLAGEMSSRDAYTGPSTFVDLIHRIQLELTGADVSMAAPLSFDTRIQEGDFFMSDLFKLYKYENFLYTMTLTGEEIRNFLEYSYEIWTNRMTAPEDHLLLLRKEERSGRYRFVNASYNFDSAAGITYMVDVTRPAGEKVWIAPFLANGKPFDLQAKYAVAINSYRGNGGGGHLTAGSKIPHGQLKERITASTPIDLRYYMMTWMEREEKIVPEIITDWKFVPENWTVPAAEWDRSLLFTP